MLSIELLNVVAAGVSNELLRVIPELMLEGLKSSLKLLSSSKFSKRANCPTKRIRTVSSAPFLCFAMITSPTP